MALIKCPTAAMLLLALVVAAAAVSTSTTEAASWTTAKKGGSGRRHDDDDDDGQRPPLSTGLTQCVTACGTQVTSCFLECYKPLVSADPVALPLCLLNCTNNAMICANDCSADIV